MNENRKRPCPDCHECQMCAESRCRACTKDGYGPKAGELGPSMTFGQYLEWREKREKACLCGNPNEREVNLEVP